MIFRRLWRGGDGRWRYKGNQILYNSDFPCNPHQSPVSAQLWNITAHVRNSNTTLLSSHFPGLFQLSTCSSSSSRHIHAHLIKSQVKKTIIIPRFEVEREKETIHPSMDKNTFRNFWSNPSSDPWITQSCVYWNKKNVDIVPKRKKKSTFRVFDFRGPWFFFYIPGPQRKITKLKRAQVAFESFNVITYHDLSTDSNTFRRCIPDQWSPNRWSGLAGDRLPQSKLSAFLRSFTHLSRHTSPTRIKPVFNSIIYLSLS